MCTFVPLPPVAAASQTEADPVSVAGHRVVNGEGDAEARANCRGARGLCVCACFEKGEIKRFQKGGDGRVGCLRVGKLSSYERKKARLD